VKAYQVFARMSPERTHTLLEGLRAGAPAIYTQALAAASAWLRARPQFVMKQSPEKRAKLVRQALARVSTSLVAEEVLAAYFLQVKKPLLIEWLDAIGLEHEEGGLKADAPPEPERAALEKAVAAYRSKPDDAADRALLLEAFAAQSAIDWPALEELIAASPPG
jgi:hypothetical protein